METYHKIQTLFKRHTDGPKKGKMIRGAWTTPELEYLAGNEWEFTEKVDGTNIRIGMYQNGERPVCFKGRSDNAVIPEPLRRYLEETFTLTRLEKGLSAEAILFGEGYGPKIQNGGKYRDDVSFVLFDVKIGPWWLDRDNVNDIAEKLGIDAVPVLGYGTLYDGIQIVSGEATVWGKGENYGPNKSGPLKSKWGNFDAEGIVARPKVPLFNRKGERIITKIKAVDFK